METLIRCSTEEPDARSDERGFTLIEMMIVVLIMGILMAVAVPTFLGATKSAANRAAESTLKTAYEDVRAVYAGDDTYTDVFSGQTASQIMAQQEPAIKWDTQKTSNSGDVAVTYTNNTSQPAVGAVGIAYWQSRTSTCFMIWDDPSNETVSYYANNITAATDCAAPTQAPSSSVPLWGGPSDTGAADGS